MGFVLQYRWLCSGRLLGQQHPQRYGTNSHTGMMQPKPAIGKRSLLM
jgi:deoxyinosine 3'endonuclease (endonuclease V)